MVHDVTEEEIGRVYAERAKNSEAARMDKTPTGPLKDAWRHPDVVDVPLPGEEDVTTRDAAAAFLRACGLTPTEDAVGQLAEFFLPCLRIMIERGYDPTGGTWRKEGWRAMLYKAHEKLDRLWYRSWLHAEYDSDSGPDAANFLGFYHRMQGKGDPWGDNGEPGE